MKTLKKFLAMFGIAAALMGGNAAHAQGIPVIDAANLAQAINQVQAWATQYQQMVQQINQLQQQYNSITGIRNMGDLVNNPALRNYLPSDYSTILSQGVGNWQQIYQTSQKFDISQSPLASTSQAAQQLTSIAKQAAINRASAEQAYSTASQRFSDIQVLLDKVNAAPDPKDIQDLQGRIQAEQVMMQNEATKLQALKQLADAQRDIQTEQSRELHLKAAYGPMPAGY